MGSKPFTVVSSTDQFDGGSSPGGILQWALRFCQAPESFPVFSTWIRSIWPECPFSDEEIAEDLRLAHNTVGRVLKEADGRI